MIPSALAAQLERGLADYLRASFWSTTPGFEGAIDRLVAEQGALLKGPYVSAALPFAKGSHPDYFPDVPLGFTPHVHQEQAFGRLGGESKLNTLVATGTGSGKTECFLLPILSHCFANAGQPGIKAILIYPMNALATDQAGRIAGMIDGNPKLKGIRAGLFVGRGQGRQTEGLHKTMGPDHVITDHETLRLSPPDVLLTNYKMLDLLLVRPRDRKLWEGSVAGSLRFLVVDELHTFDGAQGTDLACLIRRLKNRLKLKQAELCCVGTSATLGGPESGETLREYAEKIFGESFDPDAIVGEVRQELEVFLGDTELNYAKVPEATARATLDPTEFTDGTAYLQAQATAWFEEPIADAPSSGAWKVALGEALKQHSVLTRLLECLQGRPRNVNELAEELGSLGSEFAADTEFARLALLSFLTLVSEARVWRDEVPEARARREKRKAPRPTGPFLEVRLQLWIRELKRMVATVGPLPRIRFADDLTRDQRRQHLPLVYCRDCGAMGWATLLERDKPHRFRAELPTLYRGFFSKDSRVQFLFPAKAVGEHVPWVDKATRRWLHHETLNSIEPDHDGAPDELVTEVVLSPVNHRTVKGKEQLHKDCPFCGAREVLMLVGFQAATLTSVLIDQLFASSFNRDKKLLAYSDSVQDAAHRAGFFGARTWRFNLRLALQRFLVAAGEGIPLADLPKRFDAWWRSKGQLDDMTYVGAFLAPSMTWLPDFETFRQKGALPEDSDLLELIQRRIAWEAVVEFGFRSRIGRSLPRTGSSVAGVDPDRLSSVLDELLPVIQNEVGGFEQLERDRLWLWLSGVLRRLLERGGVLSPELPAEFIETGGAKVFGFKMARHLPGYRPGSRLPVMLTDRTKTYRFEFVLGSGADLDWQQRWYQECFSSVNALPGAVGTAMSLALPVLVKHEVLDQRLLKGETGRIWGLRPHALRLTTHVLKLRCDQCGHFTSVPRPEAEQWKGAPCLTARCTGKIRVETDAPPEFFARLYSTGELERINAEEHTGLLTRDARERVEQEFKAEGKERRPWYPNLLSCTPTLEMGIDIGDLSAAILCSVPPAQANYLQRIGRTGRRDGSSLVLTIANGRDHDLYFYAEPQEMLAGSVATPGVYLNASAVLERQLTAFCLDRWVASGVEESAFPRQMRQVLSHFGSENRQQFPYNLIGFIQDYRTELLKDFLGLFEQELSESTKAHLSRFIAGDDSDEEGLARSLLVALDHHKTTRDSLRSKANRLTTVVREREKSPVKDKNFEDELDELRRERSALRALATQLDNRQVLNVFTDDGLIPNYAFPEAAVRLRSVIWRKKKDAPEKGEGKRYDTWSYEYGRGAGVAISELAPENTFYAGGRRVKVDQVDLELTGIENWQFCDSCSYSKRILGEGSLGPECPSCGSSMWADPGQRQQLVRLQQVFANTRDSDSRIGDDQDERRPKFYNRQTLVSFHSDDQEGAWRLGEDTVPFAFEFLRKATFREVNFGEFSDDGTKVAVGGQEAVRTGFVICRLCGKVQTSSRRGGNRLNPNKPEHALSCPARKKDAAKNFEECVYLYREFASEAIRMLLPLTQLGSEKQLQSFVAALQLGLKEYFHGKVDHLRTTLNSEPVKDSSVRRQFLVLYDGIPGGTGYLKELVQDPQQLFEVLEKARQRLTTCECNRDDRDGCYRCLFAYGHSSQLSEISRKEAVGLLTWILEHRLQLEKVDSLGEVSLTGLLGSVLEARFLEALRRSDNGERPCSLTKAIVAGRPGYRCSIGDRTWAIELQKKIPIEDGLGLEISVDFVFRQVRGEGDPRPIAVFTDGWEHHHDRVGYDCLQSLAMIRNGGYDVWRFHWWDLAEALGEPTESYPNLLYRDHAKLHKVLAGYREKRLARRLDQSAFEWFVDTLEKPDWASANQLAWLTQFSQLGPLSEQELETWRTEVEERAPDSVLPLFEEGTTNDLYAQWPASPDLPFSLYARARREDVLADQEHLKTGTTQGLRILACLEDGPEANQNPERLRETWCSLLRLGNLLRALPNAWLVARSSTGALSDKYRTVNGLFRDQEGGDSAWDEVAEDVGQEYQDLVKTMREAQVPVPEVGLDLPSEAGHTTGAQGELVWPELRVAVVDDDELKAAQTPVAKDWKVLTLGSLAEELAQLLKQLKPSGGEGPPEPEAVVEVKTTKVHLNFSLGLADEVSQEVLAQLQKSIEAAGGELVLGGQPA